MRAHRLPTEFFIELKIVFYLAILYDKKPEARSVTFQTAIKEIKDQTEIKKTQIKQLL